MDVFQLERYRRHQGHHQFPYPRRFPVRPTSIGALGIRVHKSLRNPLSDLSGCTFQALRNASLATLALKASVNGRHRATSTSCNLGEGHLDLLSEPPEPPLSVSKCT